jgi:hypothetical protein
MDHFGFRSGRMKQNPAKEHIRQYVLGVLDLQEQEQFEERLLSDAKLLEQVSIVEDEIVWDYLADALSEADKKSFDEHFLTTPHGRLKLQFLRSFNDQLPASSIAADFTDLPRSLKRFLPAFLRGESPWLRISFATAIVVLIVGGLLLARQTWSNPPRKLAVFTAALGKSPTKSIDAGELPLVEVPAGMDLIELQIPINRSTATSYSASLFTDQGQEKFHQDDLRLKVTAAGTLVPVQVPSSILTSGDYRLKLRTHISVDKSEEVATHSFRVIRR